MKKKIGLRWMKGNDLVHLDRNDMVAVLEHKLNEHIPMKDKLKYVRMVVKRLKSI